MKLIKGELKIRGLSYGDLAHEMSKRGFEITEAAVRNRLHRGHLSATFLLGSLAAMGLETDEAAAFLMRAHVPAK